MVTDYDCEQDVLCTKCGGVKNRDVYNKCRCYKYFKCSVYIKDLPKEKNEFFEKIKKRLKDERI